MTATTSLRLMLVSCATLVATGCGAPSQSSSSVTAPATGPASATAAPSQAAANVSTSVALTASDLPLFAKGFKQTKDGLLNGVANTDSRVFASADGAVALEIDIADDTSPSQAGTDYAPFASASARQVATQAGTSTPAIGQRANETVGTDASGRSAVSLSFVQGTFIVVVTMKSAAGMVDPATVEATAAAQAARIAAAH